MFAPPIKPTAQTIQTVGVSMSIKKHLFTFACSVVAATAAGATYAGEASQISWFRVLDRDANGDVSLHELQTIRNTRFFNMDTNRDFVLSRNELANNAGWQRRFRRLDTNEDDKITLREFEHKGRTRFEAIDQNRDGRITPQEALTFQRKVRRHWEKNLKARKIS